MIEKKLAAFRCAQRKAKRLLKRKFSDAEKVAVFENIRRLACEELKHRLEFGYSNKHIDDAFKTTVVQCLFGDNYYDWVYDLDARTLG